MLCIASFIVFLILGIFSTYYRSLAKKAWACVGKRVTFRPCDTSFSDEVKGKLFGKMMFSRPRLAKFLEKWVDVFAFLFVAISIWSLFSVALTGLNLWVYDTCSPAEPASCSLSGEACAINTNALTLSAALSQGKIGEYLAQPFVTFGETISRVPDRFTNWKAEDYIAPTATYYLPLDSAKPTALEVIDPSCLYCKKLFANIKDAGFEKTHNLTYLVYPIADSSTTSGYKFPHSYMIASYMEALKTFPLPNSDRASDWLLLEKIFTEKDRDGTELQTKFVSMYSKEEAEVKLTELIGELGYTEPMVADIIVKVKSPEVAAELRKQKEIVEQKVKTLKIPTIIFSGRRYDRVVEADKLK